MPASQIDPIQLEIFKHLFASIAEEMGVVLRKASYSPNIKGTARLLLRVV